MKRIRRDAGYMIMVVLIFGIVLTALGAVLLWPTNNALSQSHTMEARLAARQAARSGLEVALEAPADGQSGRGTVGAATYRYEVGALADGRLRIRVAGRAQAWAHEEEAVLETEIRIEDGHPVHETWRLYARRARD